MERPRALHARRVRSSGSGQKLAPEARSPGEAQVATDDRRLVRAVVAGVPGYDDVKKAQPCRARRPRLGCGRGRVHEIRYSSVIAGRVPGRDIVGNCQPGGHGHPTSARMDIRPRVEPWDPGGLVDSGEAVSTSNCHTPASPSGNNRQTGPKTEDRRPHGRTLSTLSGVPPDARRPSDRLTRSTRPPRELTSRPPGHAPRLRTIAFQRSPPAAGGNNTVTVPQRGVPGERRQERCQFPQRAPRGRLATGRYG